MRRTWSLSASRDGWAVHVREEPGWAQAVETVWDRLCTLTRGWAGGHNLPEVFWRIPVGRPRWDRDDPDEPWLINSLAGKLFSLEQWAMSRTHDHGRELVAVPVGEDVARQVDAGFVDEWNVSIQAGS